MKRMLVVLLVVAFAVTSGFAQDPKPMTKAGDKALMFDLGGLAALSANNYQGGMGFKYYLSKGLALRAALGFRSSSETTKNPVSPTPTNQIGESKLSTFEFSIAPGVQVNLAQTGPVVAYVGAQVGYTSSNTSREGSTNINIVDFDKDTKSEVSSSIFSAAAFIGFEWFPWTNISLAGEYRLGFSSSSGKTKITLPPPAEGTETDSPSTTQFGLASGNAAALTLAVYF
jgi:opacity protein-like surface antigen